MCGLNTTHGPNSHLDLISQADHELNLTPLGELCSGSQTRTGWFTGSRSQESHIIEQNHGSFLSSLVEEESC